MTEHIVVITGAGPTGLMLAGELALARVNFALVERRTSQDLISLRTGGLHSRTIEVFAQRGIVDRFLSQGTIAQVAAFAGVSLDITSTRLGLADALTTWFGPPRTALKAR